VDPCPGVCGSHASCRTTRHQPDCTCDPGYTGDPFRFCSRITTGIVEYDTFNQCCGSRKKIMPI
jgi:hypothetical protein